MKYIVFGLCAFISTLVNANDASTCTTLNVAGSSQWRPFSYIERTPAPVAAGIAHDVVKLIALELSLELNVLTGIPWKRIERQLETGEIDILAGNYWSQERAKKWLLSEPIASEPVHLFTLANNYFEFDDLSDLSSKRGVAPSGISLGKDFEKVRNQFDFFDVRLHEQMYEMLRLGRIDYLVSPKFAAQHHLNKPENSKVVMLPKPINHYSIHLSLSPSSPCALLLPKINQEISNLKAEGVIERLLYVYSREAG